MELFVEDAAAGDCMLTDFPGPVSRGALPDSILLLLLQDARFGLSCAVGELSVCGCIT